MNANRKPNRKKLADLQYIRLPYDFVPFDKDQYRFPYTSAPSSEDGKMPLPGHDRVEPERLSGELRYRMIPQSDLVVEVREKWGGGHFVSGSVVRGKIRSNAEMLSRSYPEFVNRAPLMYRDIQSEKYKKRLFGLEDSDQNQDLKGIEHYIRVGYLQKIEGKFYIIPAEKFGDKYFLSIHEHRLRNMDVGNNRNFPWLYHWKEETIKEFERMQTEMDQLTREIRQLKEPYKQILEDRFVSRWFAEEMAFSKIKGEVNQKIENLKKENGQISDVNERKNSLANQLIQQRQEHLNKLVGDFIQEKGLTEPQASDIRRIFEKTFKRWILKWNMDVYYQSATHRKKRNLRFEPYQRLISYDLDDNGGVRDISTQVEKYKLKGYLFCSTNASSKRSHYLIRLPNWTATRLQVKDEIINAYNRNLERIRFTQSSSKDFKPKQVRKEMEKKIKKFYDIFNNYDQLIRQYVPIVFYRVNQNGEVQDLGRTPHMKIQYKTNLVDLLGTKPDQAVDYASALFGYVNDSKSDAEGHAYKSRILFRPVEMKGNPEEGKKTKHFILMTPQPTAAGMYLRQDGRQKKTYEDSADTLRLNGWKYYHVRQKEKEPSEENSNESFSSARYVYRKDGLKELKGTVVFQNLTPAELGLLLLAFDIRLIRQSKYWDVLQKSHDPFTIDERFLDRCFELIGGAKPYGYGKVRVEVLELRLDKADYDFETLMFDSMNPESEDNWNKYIDAFLDDMGGEAFVQSELFGSYLVSKFEIDDKEFCEQDIEVWDVMIQSKDDNKSKENHAKSKNNDKQVKESTGYKKIWVLKRRYQTSQP